MPLRLGHLIVTKCRKEAQCVWDKQDIPVGEFYFTILYKVKSGKVYGKKFCSQVCKDKYEIEQVDKYKLQYDEHKGRASGQTKFSNLTPEQIVRRRTLLHWLSTRDRPALLRAYQRQSTIRVHKVMSTMHKRFIELETFGVSYPLTISSQNKELGIMIAKYDYKLVDKWLDIDTINTNDRIALLIRQDEPDWDSTKEVSNPLTEKEYLEKIKVIVSAQPAEQYIEDRSDRERE